jgi:hypothetical protein
MIMTKPPYWRVAETAGLYLERHLYRWQRHLRLPKKQVGAGLLRSSAH